MRKDYIRKGLIDDPDKPRRLENAIHFVGECQDMCPEFERYEREYQKNLDKLEIVIFLFLFLFYFILFFNQDVNYISPNSDIIIFYIKEEDD